MATRGGWDQLVMLDRKAAELARGVGRMTLLLGECLSALAEREGHHALGFSSLGAYVQERCGRTARWARDVVRVARGVAKWPALRRALLAGEVTWSAAEIVLRALERVWAGEAALAPGVLEQAEAHWSEQAKRLSVRELRAAVMETTVLPEAELRESGGVGGAAREETHRFLRRLPTHVLTLSVQTETAWWLECARRVYERSVSDCAGPVRSNESFLLALLAEARVELEAEDCGTGEALVRWGKYVEQLATWREESERRCDGQRRQLDAVRVEAPAGGEGSRVLGSGVLGGPVLDERVRELTAALTCRELELGRLAEWLQRAEAWRRLGFASETHYVRERMGLSYSQWKLRRQVVRRLGAFPGLEAAVGAGEVGFEAAALLVQVLSCARRQLGCDGAEVCTAQREGCAALEAAWLERAQTRTFKHLREEVRAAELAAQQWDVLARAPAEETMQRLIALEGRVKSGAVLLESEEAAESRTSVAGYVVDDEKSEGAAAEGRTSVAGRAWLDLRGELGEILGGAFLGGPGEPLAPREPSLGRPNLGRPHLGRERAVRLRLRLERDTLVEFRCLEKLFRRQHAGDFLEFLCRHFLAVWAPAMLTNVKYAHVYRRDAFTCTSPVCERHDVQPHHLKFRSAGGGEEDENLTSLCTWCHLTGVHGGRIRVAPPASRMQWQIGPPLLEVHGRELVRRGAGAGMAHRVRGRQARLAERRVVTHG